MILFIHTYININYIVKPYSSLICYKWITDIWIVRYLHIYNLLQWCSGRMMNISWIADVRTSQRAGSSRENLQNVEKKDSFLFWPYCQLYGESWKIGRIEGKQARRRSPKRWWDETKELTEKLTWMSIVQNWEEESVPSIKVLLIFIHFTNVSMYICTYLH